MTSQHTTTEGVAGLPPPLVAEVLARVRTRGFIEEAIVQHLVSVVLATASQIAENAHGETSEVAPALVVRREPAPDRKLALHGLGATDTDEGVAACHTVQLTVLGHQIFQFQVCDSTTVTETGSSSTTVHVEARHPTH